MQDWEFLEKLDVDHISSLARLESSLKNTGLKIFSYVQQNKKNQCFNSFLLHIIPLLYLYLNLLTELSLYIVLITCGT